MPERHPGRFFLTVLATGGLWLALTSPAVAQGPRVGGQVVDSRREPIASVELTLHPLPSAYWLDRALLEGTRFEGVSSVRSDREGRFELEAPEAGMWLLTATAGGRTEVGVFLRPLPHLVELEPIVLEATREVWVEVVDGDGQPVPSARVVLDARPGRRATYALDAGRAHGWPRRQAGLTDETGRLRLLAPESGEYMLQVIAAGFVPWSGDPRSSSSERVVLRWGAPRTLLVRDPDGRPLSKALVRLASGEVPLGLTDEQGRATLGVPQGEPLEVRVLSPEGGDAEATLRAEGSVSPLEIVVEPPAPLTGLDSRIAYGTVVDESDRPISAALVTLTPTSQRLDPGDSHSANRHSEPIRARSGDRGRFELPDVTSGTFDLRAEASGFAPVTVPAVEIPTAGRQVDIGTLVLVEGATAEGRVTDVWGRPLANAEVRVHGEASLATSDADGRFVVADLAPGQTVELRVSLAGYAPATLRAVRAPTDRPLEIVLENVTVLRGRVVDERGDPVAAARLRLVAEPGSTGDSPTRASASLVRFTSTDTTGSFEIPDVIAGRWDLAARAEGFQNGGEEAIEVVAGEEPQEVRVVLRQGAVVHGRVVDLDGEPVASARVSALSESRPPFHARSYRSTTTDSDGTYRLGGLPTRRMSFSVEHPDHPGQARDLEVELGGSRLDFQLEDGWEISGRVVDAGGRPVSGAQVRALPPSKGPAVGPEAREPVVTGGDGSFTVSVLAHGNYIVRAEKSGYASARTEEAVRIEGQSAYGVELRLERGGAIAGRVTGLELDELARVRVLAVRPGRSVPPAMGHVDYEGLYRLENLPWGDWMIIAVVGEMGKNVRRTVTLDPGAEEVPLDLEFGDGLTLSGQVVRTSKPVPGAQVRAVATETFSGSRVMTDQEGRFRLEGLDPGTYHVVVSDLDTGPEQQEGVRLDGDREILIELKAYVLRGQVLDELDGTPIRGANVALARTERAGYSPVLRTDARGVFRFAGIAPGSYRLRVNKVGYGNGGAEVEIDERGEVPAIEVRLRPSEGLTLYVLHPTGAPAVDVNLMALDTAGQPLLAGRYDAGEGGRIRLVELPAGTWTLLAAARGTATVSQRIETPGGPVTVRLPESGGLAVQVPALVGTRRLARLTLLDQRGRPYRDVHTGQGQWNLVDGMATVPLLPAGAWTLEVRTADEELVRTTEGRVVPGRILDVFIE